MGPSQDAAKTDLSSSSIIPSYSSHQRQTVAGSVEEEIFFDGPPPAYDVSQTEYASSSHPVPAATTIAAVPTATAVPTIRRRPSRASIESQMSREDAPLTGRRGRDNSGESGYRMSEPMSVGGESRSDKGQPSSNDDPGCCWSSHGACCFSDNGACCFSDHDACCFSDHDACCFSDNSACCFSDNEGCCFSDNGGVFFGDNGGTCCSRGRGRSRS